MASRSYSKDPVITEVSGGWRDTCGSCPGDYTGWGTLEFTPREELGKYWASELPDFHRRKAAGELLPPQEYGRWDYYVQRDPYMYDYSSRTDVCGACGAWTHHHPRQVAKRLGVEEAGIGIPGVYLDGGNPFTEPDWDALLVRALAGLNPEFDLLTTLAEAHQTVDLVVKARRNAKDLVVSALRGGRYTAKAASDAWLAWRYGWEQLGRDITSIHGLINEPLRPEIISASAGVSSSEERPLESTDTQDCTWVFGPGPNYLHWDLSSSAQVDESYRARVDAKVDSRTLNALADIPLTAWELVPYSFVADWFVNVGAVLGAWKVLRSFTNIVTSVSSKREIVVYSGESVRQSGPGMYNASGYGSSHEKYVARLRSKGWIPSLVPSITVHLTSERILDAAALMAKRIL